MPNWCEGSLRMRGKFKNLKNFFKSGLMVHRLIFNGLNTTIECPELLSIEYDEPKYFLMNIGSDAHITGTERAFVLQDDIEFSGKGKGVCSCAVRIKQAWDFNAEEFRDLAFKYSLDMRLNGFERGGEFSREIIIEGGVIIKDETTQYNDYDYECIMPMLGG